MKWVLALLTLICIGFSYVSFGFYRERSKYLEACFYFSETKAQKITCDSVYSKDTEHKWLVAFISGVAASAVLGSVTWLFFIADND